MSTNSAQRGRPDLEEMWIEATIESRMAPTELQRTDKDVCLGCDTTSRSFEDLASLDQDGRRIDSREVLRRALD